jgi:hypothetical protein
MTTNNNNNVKQGWQINVLLSCTHSEIQITSDGEEKKERKKNPHLKLGTQFYKKKTNFNIRLLDLFYYCNY